MNVTLFKKKKKKFFAELIKLRILRLGHPGLLGEGRGRGGSKSNEAPL